MSRLSSLGKRSDQSSCPPAGVLLGIPICYVWRKPSAMPHALNNTRATSKHPSAISVAAQGHCCTDWVVKVVTSVWSQHALTAAAPGGIARLGRPVRMAWAHWAGSWLSLDCRKLLRQRRDRVKICKCCPPWGVVLRQNTVGWGGAVPV